MSNDTPEKTPFNSPRDPAQPPYHLRNGIPERAEIDRHEAEHRRRMGMQTIGPRDSDRERFEAWLATLEGTYGEAAIASMWRAWQAAQS